MTLAQLNTAFNTSDNIFHLKKVWHENVGFMIAATYYSVYESSARQLSSDIYSVWKNSYIWNCVR